MKMNKLALITFALFLLSLSVFPQNKSIADAETEIKSFQNFTSFSVSYDDPKDLTTAKVVIDLRNDEKSLKKSFKKFYWELISIYSGNAIDQKPVRNLLCLNTQGKRLRFGSNNLLTFMLENESVDFGEPQRSTKVKGSKVNENLCWDINKEIIEDFAQADDISFKIGSFNNSFGAVKLQIFKDYAKLLKIKEN